MIRSLVLVLALALGLGLALAAFGRMAHLRGLVDLPDWTQAVAGDAGLLAGQAGLPGGFALGWRLSRIGLTGPVWTGVIERHDTRLDLTATLRRAPEAGLHLWLRIGPGTATPEGPGLSGHFGSVVGTGQVTGTGLWLDLDGRGVGLEAGGEGRADGPVNLNIWPGGWRLALGAPNRWQTLGEDPVDLLGH
jgi:hypothetical protein